MAITEKSWDGLDLMVFARSPGQAMELEQDLAAALPALEVKLESFEIYEDALDFCKNRKNVGFIFMVEDNLNPPVGELFRNLTQPFSNNGWDAFGALVHTSGETLQGNRITRLNNQLIDYVPRSSFMDELECRKQLQTLWQKFVNAFENQFIPQALQETVIATALKSDQFNSLSFYEQTCNLLTSNLNISWREKFALKWYQAIVLANKQEPAVLAPHVVLQKLVTSLRDEKAPTNLLVSRLKDQTIPLGTRVLELVLGLNDAKVQGKLPELLDSFNEYAKPGGPALLRTVAKQRQAIMGFSSKLRAVG